MCNRTHLEGSLEHSPGVWNLVTAMWRLSPQRDTDPQKYYAECIPGDHVSVMTSSGTHDGQVRWTGVINDCERTQKSGMWVGVELEDKVGRHDGTASDGNRYFVCKEGHGIFVRPQMVKRREVAPPLRERERPEAEEDRELLKLQVAQMREGTEQLLRRPRPHPLSIQPLYPPWRPTLHLATPNRIRAPLLAALD